jgi:hypothetical protein
MKRNRKLLGAWLLGLALLVPLSLIPLGGISDSFGASNLAKASSVAVGYTAVVWFVIRPQIGNRGKT